MQAQSQTHCNDLGPPYTFIAACWLNNIKKKNTLKDKVVSVWCDYINTDMLCTCTYEKEFVDFKHIFIKHKFHN